MAVNIEKVVAASPEPVSRDDVLARSIRALGISAADLATTVPLGPAPSSLPHEIPLTVVDGTMKPNEGTVAMVAWITPARILRMTHRFYRKAARDKALDLFLESHDDPHGDRLGLWIIEKMTGKEVWKAFRPPDSRSRAHAKAWHSFKRPEAERGNRFKVPDARIWMRLMFWSAREEGLAVAPFWPWFIKFIAHFMRVYERAAPPYAPESAAWSESPERTAKWEQCNDMKSLL